jgi:serine phosphatase RsbU (regulator of sigma subunit)
VLSDGIYEYRNAGNEEFGELRVEVLLKRYREASAAELAAKILGAVQAFAGDAVQEDDMTVLLVKRRSDS